MNDDCDISKFLNSNYAIRLTNTRHITNLPIYTDSHPPSIPDMNGDDSYNLDISISIHISIIEAYKGCIKEEVLHRRRFIGEAAASDNQNHEISEKICIEIPEGILHHEIITIQNKGNILVSSRYGNIYGNINVTVNVAETLPVYSLFKYFSIGNGSQLQKYNVSDNDYYTKSGNDAILHKTLTLKEALCGYKFIIPHFNGKLYEIASKPNDIVTPDYKTTLVLAGFNRNNKIGNLIVVYTILFPENLTTRQISCINAIL